MISFTFGNNKSIFIVLVAFLVVNAIAIVMFSYEYPDIALQADTSKIEEKEDIEVKVARERNQLENLFGPQIWLEMIKLKAKAEYNLCTIGKESLYKRDKDGQSLRDKYQKIKVTWDEYLLEKMSQIVSKNTGEIDKNKENATELANVRKLLKEFILLSKEEILSSTTKSDSTNTANRSASTKEILFSNTENETRFCNPDSSFESVLSALGYITDVTESSMVSYRLNRKKDRDISLLGLLNALSLRDPNLIRVTETVTNVQVLRKVYGKEMDEYLEKSVRMLASGIQRKVLKKESDDKKDDEKRKKGKEKGNDDGEKKEERKKESSKGKSL